MTKKYHVLRFNRLKRFLSSSEKICSNKNFRLFHDFGMLTLFKEKLRSECWLLHETFYHFIISLSQGTFRFAYFAKIGMRNMRNDSWNPLHMFVSLFCETEINRFVRNPTNCTPYRDYKRAVCLNWNSKGGFRESTLMAKHEDRSLDWDHVCPSLISLDCCIIDQKSTEQSENKTQQLLLTNVKLFPPYHFWCASNLCDHPLTPI